MNCNYETLLIMGFDLAINQKKNNWCRIVDGWEILHQQFWMVKPCQTPKKIMAFRNHPPSS